MLEQEGESKEEISNLINNYVKKIDLQALAGIPVNSPVFQSSSQHSQINQMNQMNQTSSATAVNGSILNTALYSSALSANSSSSLPADIYTIPPSFTLSLSPSLSHSPSHTPSHSNTHSPSHSPTRSSQHSLMPSHLPSKINPIRTSKSLLPKSLFPTAETEHSNNQLQHQLQVGVEVVVEVEVNSSSEVVDNVQSSEPVGSGSSRDVDLLRVIEKRASQIELEVTYYFFHL